MGLPRFSKRAGVAVLVAALAACSSGGGSLVSSGGVPARLTQSLAGSARTVSATLLQPLTFSMTGTTGSVSLYGSSQCGTAAGSGNWCPGVDFSGTSWDTPSNMLATMGTSSLKTTCAAPAGAPAPASGFTPGCYIVALEGGAAGPYLVQGPAIQNGGTLEFQASAMTLNLDGDIAYNFFLAYVTAISLEPTPTPFVPSPSPLPTEYATPWQPPATATPCTDDDGSASHQRGKHRMHEHHHRSGVEDCGDDD